MMISVIVPVYKVEHYLRRCVDSILKQTYKDYEILLVDDGSPDGSGLICDEYAACFSRVRVIHKENGGLSDARNVGILQATGSTSLSSTATTVCATIICPNWSGCFEKRMRR